MSLADFRRMIEVPHSVAGWITLEMMDPHRPAPITLCAADGAGDAVRLELTVEDAQHLFDVLAEGIAVTVAAHAALEAAATRRRAG